MPARVSNHGRSRAPVGGEDLVGQFGKTFIVTCNLEIQAKVTG
jgi:hypothetical protein